MIFKTVEFNNGATNCWLLVQAIFKCEVCSTHPVLRNILENESQQKYYRDQILTPKTLGMDEDFYPIKNGRVVKQICTFENVIYNICFI